MTTPEALMSELLAFALAFPGAHEDHPWGETVVKVDGKVFVFLGHPKDHVFGLSVKLPLSADEVLGLPFTEPTGYGLGKSGWISARFKAGDALDGALLKRWIGESYRAVAKKKRVKELDERG
jgi:predicted DNA-binding protein (MmcQ/YjbR family)